jgi:putative peptide zinc metalloprotease protein
LAPTTASLGSAGGAGLGGAARDRLASSQPLVAAFQKDQPLPTKDHPTMAMVLVPSSSGPTPTTGAGSTDSDQPWVFPFDKPMPPEPGDNQALAVNTSDSSVTYDLAFALVWADGNEVLNVNEAHAYASCKDCVAVAVAFQVVLIMDDAQVIVPQNLAVAASYDCYDCITAALANQLVLSVRGEPSQQQLRALGDVWNQLIEFAGTISSRTLVEIANQLETVKGQIVAILAQARPLQSGSATATATPGPVPPTTAAAPSSIQPQGTTTPNPDVTSSPSPSPPPTGTSSSGTADDAAGDSAGDPAPAPTTGSAPTPTEGAITPAAPG